MEQNGQQRKRLEELREEIKARIDYRSFYQRFCTGLIRSSGTQLHLNCPIPSHAHSGQGSPSLSVDLQRGLFHCFSRDEGGDAIRFYQLMHNLSFAYAIREMARELGINADGQAQLHLVKPSNDGNAAPESRTDEPLSMERMSAVCEKFLEVCRSEEQTEGLNYLARRGIDAATMLRAGVTYFPRSAYRRIMRQMTDAFALDELQQSGLFNSDGNLTFYLHRLLFPFYVEGRASYFQGRTTLNGVEPRWHNMRGGVPALYNVDSLEKLPSGEIVYLVEGFTDTLTLMAHNFNAVGLVGAGGFRDEWLAPLARFRVVSALDPDAAGSRAAARYEEIFAARGKRLARLKLLSDINDFFLNHPTAPLELTLMTEAALEMMNDELKRS